MKMITKIKKHKLISIFSMIIIIAFPLIWIMYYQKDKNLVNYILENLSYISSIFGIISIALTYAKYQNDKNDKDNKKIENTMYLINYFIEDIYPLMDTLDDIRNNEDVYYKKMDKKINNKQSSINDPDIKRLKNFLKRNNNKNNKDVMAQTYTIRNIEKLDKFESWSKYYLLFNDKNLISSKDIKDEYESTFVFYMKNFSDGFKIVDPNKAFYSDCHKLYKTWEGEDFF